jgi:hypothetical protein
MLYLGYLEYYLCSIKFLNFYKDFKKLSKFWCSYGVGGGGLGGWLVNPSRSHVMRAAECMIEHAFAG